jgi:hypothetical protein
MVSHGNTIPGVYTSGPKVYNRVVLIDPTFEPWDQMVARQGSVQTWQASFNSAYGHFPEQFAKYAYDAASLLLARIDQVSTLDGSGNLVIDRMSLAAAVRNTSNFLGVTGPISLDSHGDRLHSHYAAVKFDDFNQVNLGAAWSWLGAEPTEWSLSERPGYLTIYTQDDQMNRLMQAIPSGDFEIRTHLVFTPTQNFQFGGLFINGSAGNHLALGRAFCDTSAPACVGNGIYFDRVEGDVLIGSNFAITTTVPSEIYLRIAHSGANFTAFASENGTEWTELGTHTIGFTPLSVGLGASNGSQPVAEIPAEFDFFVLEHAAQMLYVPSVQR